VSGHFGLQKTKKNSRWRKNFIGVIGRKILSDFVVNFLSVLATIEES